MGAQQLVERLPVTLLLRRSLTASAKRSMPRSEPWPLRIARIATSSIHHWGKRIPRRMRQSGSALRKLIRSDAAAGVSVVDAMREERFHRTTALISGRVEGYWDRLLMDPE